MAEPPRERVGGKCRYDCTGKRDRGRGHAKQISKQYRQRADGPRQKRSDEVETDDGHGEQPGAFDKPLGGREKRLRRGRNCRHRRDGRDDAGTEKLSDSRPVHTEGKHTARQTSCGHSGRRADETPIGYRAEHSDVSRDASDDGDIEDPVELGVQLLARLEAPELPLPAVIDRIETITTHPETTRAILEAAERRGHISRDGETVTTAGGQFLSFESEVVTKEGDFECQRCGASISTGYFMQLEAGEHGPFGSSCIKKVTGRE